MKKLEYKEFLEDFRKIENPDESALELMNKIGEEGWEVIKVNAVGLLAKREKDA